MSEECTHNCDTCGADCASRKTGPASLRLEPNPGSHIKTVIAVLSGKGGVGKSMVTSLLAAGLQRRGLKVGVLDADITGPSIPQAFGLHQMAEGTQDCMYPVETAQGLKVISLNLLLEEESDPVLWRGPLIAGLVRQFWTDVAWGDLDVLLVDMPPGTGDVPLTVFQSLPVDGAVIVTSPQDLVGMIVEKALVMAERMQIPVLALVENLSYYVCPDCGKAHHIFGEGHTAQAAAKHYIPLVCRLPIRPEVAAQMDAGTMEEAAMPELDALLDRIEKR